MKTAIYYTYNNYKPKLWYSFSKIVCYLDPLDLFSGGLEAHHFLIFFRLLFPVYGPLLIGSDLEDRRKGLKCNASSAKAKAGGLQFNWDWLSDRRGMP